MADENRDDSLVGCGCVAGGGLGFGIGLIGGALARGFLVGVCCGIGGGVIGVILGLASGAVLVVHFDRKDKRRAERNGDSSGRSSSVDVPRSS